MATRTDSWTRGPTGRAAARPRLVWADALKVVLVAGVVAAHSTMAWTGVGNWVFREPSVREPLLTLLVAVAGVAALFGMPLFFLVAGYFTPRSLTRKGVGPFLADRAVRLLVPMAAFVLVLSPPIEFVDPDNAGWTGDFWSFLPHIWWPPAPGPTWFLGVLFVFSTGYAVLRAWRPVPRHARPRPLRVGLLLGVAVLVAVPSFLIRTASPLGEEVWRLALAQAPGWVAGFALGVLAAERGWLPLEPGPARAIRRLAWAAIGVCVTILGVGAAVGYDLELFLGAGTWQSGVLAGIEGVLIGSASFWIVDVFQRRVRRQGGLGRTLGRAAYGAFIVHQGVLVLLILVAHQLDWAPEPEYLAVSALGVLVSFALGDLMTRVPGVSRVV